MAKKGTLSWDVGPRHRQYLTILQESGKETVSVVWAHGLNA
jgi:hypothetical protein